MTTEDVPDQPQHSIEISGGQGSQVGEKNAQLNQFIQTYIDQRRPANERASRSVVVGEVPQRPHAFEPRSDLIEALSSNGPGITLVRALTGMRGVGKTQLAAEYARRCIDAGWQLVAWVNAGSIGQVLDGLGLIASRLILGKQGEELEKLAAAVRHHLEVDGEDCLVVFDNVVDLGEIGRFLPAAGRSQVVITSNQTEAAGYGTAVAVNVFTPEEASSFLARRVGHHDADGAAQLATELGHLPLALAQAAAVISTQHLSYQTYLARLRAVHMRQFLKRVRPDPYPYGTAEAIFLALDAANLEDQTGLCQSLMDVISVLSEAGVPRTLLYAAARASFIGQPAPAPEVFSAQVDEAIGHLASASLLSFSVDDSTVSAHRLTMRVIREYEADRDSLVNLGMATIGLLDAVAQSLPEPWRNRLAARDALQQIIALNDHLTPHLYAQEDKREMGLLQLRAWVVWCINDLGDDSKQAIEHGEMVLFDRERVLGESHPDALASRNNLAAAYRAAGRVEEAAVLYERILASYRQMLGDDDLETLLSKNNLAAAYGAMERTDEAISLYEKTLSGRQRVLGDDHPSTLLSRNNLAVAYRSAGRVDEAIPLLERTLADYERILNDDHPSTLMARNNLAMAYRAAKRMDEAVPLLERTLTDRERVLGQRHPSTLVSRNNLAGAYRVVGREVEAIALYEQTLTDRERVLGENHPSTLTSRSNLATAYRDMGRFAEAVPIYAEILAHRERILGDDDPETLLSRDNLAAAYRGASRPTEAIPLYEKILRSNERSLGNDSREALRSRFDLAMVYEAAGRSPDALKLIRDALSVGEPTSPDLVSFMWDKWQPFDFMFTALAPTGRGVALLELIYNSFEQAMGRYSPKTRAVGDTLVRIYKDSGQFGKADKLFNARW